MISKFTRFTFILTLAALFFTGCTKDKTDLEDIYIITGTALAEQTDPVLQSNAIAAISGGYNAKYKKVAFNITWTNLESSPTGTCIFCTNGASGMTNAMLIKDFGVTEGGVSGLSAGEIYLTAEQAADLVSGKWTYTVNTVDKPNGALKGRVYISQE